jgi:ABC-type Fe3+ transport system substrate-binding protein
MIRQLRARATDLPALLRGLALDTAAPPPLLRIPRVGVVITATPAGLIWSARDPAAAKRFDDHLITTTA